MKKILLLVCAVITSTLVSAQCSEIFISEYVEGTGNNKALEFYNPTASPITLTGVYVARQYDNGATTPTMTRPLVGTIPAYGTFVLVNGQVTTDPVGTGTSPPCDPTLQAMANQLDSAHYPAVCYFNGDDAITIEKKVGTNYVIVDIFARIGERPTNSSGTYTPSGAWTATAPYNTGVGTYWTKKHTMRRKSTVMQGLTVNPSFFNPAAEYDSLRVNTFTGLGTHTCACFTGIHEYANDVQVNVFPNPVSSGSITVSAGENILSIELFNILGELLSSEKINNVSTAVVKTEIPKGIYFVKTHFAGQKVHISRIIVQ